MEIADNDTQTLNDLMLLDIFYPSTYYTMIEETEKTSLFEFIGGIGGHLGKSTVL